MNVFCHHCGKEYRVKPYLITTTKFCSLKCRGDSARKRFNKPCDICGKNFEFIATRIDRAKYCSTICYNKSQRGKGTIKYRCHHCNQDFFSYKRLGRKFCSKKCTGKGNKKEWKAKFSTVRKKMITRNLIKICNRCGFNQEPKILGVHHKDRNRNNNKMSNLEILCPNCHSLEHNKHIVVHS